ncbi:hypothetical protein L6452_08940 [Arctium lappa]|uniref:Uncharacterized protein n=1 Tax=Arctium lappa TaxID=4217 RepID=A0ACB9DJ43_ARCLA|nr:hypothetical protein L6452_08940 [Arctium lappa]
MQSEIILSLCIAFFSLLHLGGLNPKESKFASLRSFDAIVATIEGDIWMTVTTTISNTTSKKMKPTQLLTLEILLPTILWARVDEVGLHSITLPSFSTGVVPLISLVSPKMKKGSWKSPADDHIAELEATYLTTSFKGL